VDGCAVDVVSLPRSLADRHSSRRCANPELAIARERALLAVIADRPGLRQAEIAALVTEPVGSTATRLNRLGDRGLIERTPTHQWFIAGANANAPEEASEFEMIERTRPAFDPLVWVRHIDFFVRIETSMFACRRFG
jgi:hypothetical protein